MIHTSRQLKALVRNMSGGDSIRAQIIIRNYVMERFLERLSLSRHKDNFILKGGALVAAMVGIDHRSTLDVDTTLKNLPLSESGAREILDEIISIQIDDGMSFHIKSVSPIMDETDYPGIRVMLDTMLENMHTPLKLDLSTGDIITPTEVVYSFRLLFEERTISILAYNLETVLAEKLETLIARGTVNTRMRDFYDIYVLCNTQSLNMDAAVFKNAFTNTSKKRGSLSLLTEANSILDEVEHSEILTHLWKNYQVKYEYAANIPWNDVMLAVRALVKNIQ